MKTFLAALACALQACAPMGGGTGGTGSVASGGTGGTGITAGGGIGGTGSALGPIAAIGSVTVNGVTFETGGAVVNINGVQQAARGDLRNLEVGMTVLVRGRYNSATAGDATDILYLDNLTGPIRAINAINNSFTAMGHTILIDGDPVIGTKFDGVSGGLGGLKTDDFVEVSGAPDGAGNIVASYVRRRAGYVAGSTEIGIKGNVRDFDLARSRFRIGSLTVDYAAGGDAPFKNLTLGDLPNAPFVAVRGTRFDASGALIATAVEQIDRPVSPGPGRRLEIQGVITECAGVCRAFKVEGQAVATSAATVFENGRAEDLINNRKIEVEGVIDGTGTLAAAKARFVKGSVQIETIADSLVDPATNVFRMLGIQIKISSVTRFAGRFEPAAIKPGMPLKVLGYRISDRIIIATGIEPIAGRGDEVRLEGPLQVANKGASTFSILGVPVGTVRGTAFRSSVGESAGVITFDRFFDTTVTGTIVSARGVRTAGDRIDASGSAGEVGIVSLP